MVLSPTNAFRWSDGGDHHASTRLRLGSDDAKSDSINLGTFSAALRRAMLVDNRAVDLPGALVLPPAGHAMMQIVAETIRGHLSAEGFEEWEYPHLGPTAAFIRPVWAGEFADQLLHAGTRADFANGVPRATLAPTGEALIYTHWSRLIHFRSDLPLKMFQRTRYFRPMSSGKHAGRSVFRSEEAADVFEFHACGCDEDWASDVLVSSRAMLAQLLDKLHVPILWSLRPPWTNNRQIYDHAFGGDAPLITGGTVQLGCVYQQGDRFARAYGIRYADAAGAHYPHHVTGAITRRVLFAQLLFSLTLGGSFTLHPDFAPTQVAVIDDRLDSNGREATERWVRELARTIRVQLKTRGRLTQRAAVLAPVVITIRAPDHSGGPLQIVVERRDTGQRSAADWQLNDAFTSSLSDLIGDIGGRAHNAAIHFSESQCVAADLKTVREVIEAKKIAVVKLSATQGAVRTLEHVARAEVLGFARDERGRCVATGESIDTLAFVASRL